MLIFSQDGEKAFDTTGSTIWIGPYSNNYSHDTDSYVIYARNYAHMEPIILSKTDSLESAKNIIKAINIMAVLGVPAVDLDNDINAFIDLIRDKKDTCFKIVIDKHLSK